MGDSTQSQHLPGNPSVQDSTEQGRRVLYHATPHWPHSREVIGLINIVCRAISCALMSNRSEADTMQTDPERRFDSSLSFCPNNALRLSRKGRLQPRYRRLPENGPGVLAQGALQRRRNQPTTLKEACGKTQLHKRKRAAKKGADKDPQERTSYEIIGPADQPR